MWMKARCLKFSRYDSKSDRTIDIEATSFGRSSLMTTTKYSGECQCGACRYEINAEPFVAYTCHCQVCQKLTSSAFLSCIQIPAESFSLVTGSLVSRQRVGASGSTLTNSFCGTCSSLICIQSSSRPRLRTVTIGTLDYPASIDLSAHIWVKRKLPWITLPSNHRIFEEAGNWTIDYAEDPTRYLPEHL